MKKYLAIIMAAAILGLTVFSALPVAADTAAPAFTTVSVYSTVALMVNGIQSTQSPITCNVGDSVSIINTENYISEGERYTFQGWSNGQKATDNHHHRRFGRSTLPLTGRTISWCRSIPCHQPHQQHLGALRHPG